MNVAEEITPSDSGPSLSKGSDYSISSFALVTSDGKVIDLSQQIVSLSIYEDLWSQTMSGHVTLSDTQDIPSKFAIHGNEYLYLSIDKPSLSEPIKKVFRVYSISNRIYGVSSNDMNYTIHFCSEETLLSAQTKISKSYKGLQISEMVRDIALNYLGIKPEKLTIEATEGVFDIVIPMLDPIEAINWLSVRAYAQNKSIYLFYENKDGYNFISYETLVKTPTFAKYYKSLKFPDDPTKNLFIFNYLTGVEDFNVLKGIRYGAYSSAIMRFDMVNRRMEVKSYNAYDFFAKGGTLNGNLMANRSPNRFGRSLYDSYLNTLKYVVGNDSDPYVNPMNTQTWLGPTVAKLGQMTNFKMVGVLPGDVMLKIGSVIEVEIPNFVPKDDKYEANEFRSGKYMITAVNHTFTAEVYTTTIEMVTDSLPAPLPDHIKNSPTLEDLKRS